MTRTAKLTFGDKTLELPVAEGTDGGARPGHLLAPRQTGLITFDPGFANTGVCKSAITSIDGEKGILRYRGIPIEQLVERSSFVETCLPPDLRPSAGPGATRRVPRAADRERRPPRVV